MQPAPGSRGDNASAGRRRAGVRGAPGWAVSECPLLTADFFGWEEAWAGGHKPPGWGLHPSLQSRRCTLGPRWGLRAPAALLSPLHRAGLVCSGPWLWGATSTGHGLGEHRAAGPRSSDPLCQTGLQLFHLLRAQPAAGPSDPLHSGSSARRLGFPEGSQGFQVLLSSKRGIFFPWEIPAVF